MLRSEQAVQGHRKGRHALRASQDSKGRQEGRFNSSTSSLPPVFSDG
jgi:hypothetical protein